jgi:hypothetical protein
MKNSLGIMIWKDGKMFILIGKMFHFFLFMCTVYQRKDENQQEK